MKRAVPTILLIASALVIILFCPACTPGSCFDETNAYVKATMYSADKGKAIAPDSLSLYGLNMESEKIYQKATSAVRVTIPLNSSSENCTLVIKINNTLDTITFRYTTYPHFISKECGYTYYHDLTDAPSYTKHGIDTVTVRQFKITTINEENIRIYY